MLDRRVAGRIGPRADDLEQLRGQPNRGRGAWRTTLRTFNAQKHWAYLLHLGAAARRPAFLRRGPNQRGSPPGAYPCVYAGELGVGGTADGTHLTCLPDTGRNFRERP